jgi:hypothetical protein
MRLTSFSFWLSQLAKMNQYELTEFHETHPKISHQAANIYFADRRIRFSSMLPFEFLRDWEVVTNVNLNVSEAVKGKLEVELR